MATVTKLTPTGIHYSGELDEVSTNQSSLPIGWKNYLPYSEEFDNAAWNKFASGTGVVPVVTANYDIAPDGTMTADRIDFNSGGSGNSQVDNYGTVINGSYNPLQGSTRTFSVWMRSLTGTTPITLYNGESISIVTVTSNWQRFSYAVTYSVVSAFGVRIAKREIWSSGGSASILAWGAQWEEGPNATLYVKTGANGPISPPKRVDANGKIYITGDFDEITFNSNSGIKKNLIINSPIIDLVQWGTNGSAATQRVDILGPGNVPTIVSRISNPAILTTSDNCAVSQQPTITPGINVNYTFSIYVKKDVSDITNIYLFYQPTTRGSFLQYTFSTDTIVVGSADGGGITPTIYGRILYPNGWIRLYFSVNDSTLGTNTSLICRLYPGSRNTFRSSDSTFYWGPQLELGTSPSIYEATGANAVPLSNVVMKMESIGNTYVIGNYDEYTGIVSTTGGLIINVDAAEPTSYSGTGTTWFDISGNSGYNATPYNGSLVSTFNANNSFNLNNTTLQGFSFGGNLPKTETQFFSIEFWVKHSSFNSNGQYYNLICGKEIYLINGFRFGIATPSSSSADTTGCPYFWTNQSGGTIAASSVPSYPITLNTWYQTAVTYDGNTVRLYFNGVLLYSAAGKYNISTDTFSTPAGTNYASGLNLGTNAMGCQSMNGQIASFKWYNKTLSPIEVNDNFNGLRNRFGI